MTSMHKRYRGMGMLLALIVACLCPLSAQAQGIPTDIVFTHLTQADGLSHKEITKIFQDEQGFMWIATTGGLNRFDGYAFKSYITIPGDLSSISRDHIEDVVQDRFDPNIFWVAGYVGFNKFDRRTETFTRYFHDPDDPNSFVDNWPMRITQDANGEVWVVHWDTGLHSLTPATDHITHYPLPDDDEVHINAARSIYLDEMGQLWTGSYGHTLTRFDPVTGHYTQYRLVDIDREGSIQAIAPDDDGNFWLGMDDIPQNPGGLYHFDRQTETFTRYAAELPGFTGQSGTSARAILLDQDGILWIGYNDGLSRFDPTTKHFSFYQHQPDNPNSLLSSEVKALYQDDSGMIWVGTAEGLSRFNPNAIQFERYIPNPHNPEDNYVFDVYQDEEGFVWMALSQDYSDDPHELPDQGGLVRFDPATGQSQRYLPDPDDPNSLSLYSSNIMRIQPDDEGYLWLGSWGIERFDPRTGQVDRPLAEFQNNTFNQVLALYQDREGRLWFGDRHTAGLTQLQRNPDRFLPYLPQADDPLFYQTKFVITQDADGILWVGSSNGLLRFDPATGQYDHYEPIFDDPNSLSSNAVIDIYPTAEGMLWLAMRGGGLSYFDPTSGQVRRFYYLHDGLPAATITSIERDTQGNLWLGSRAGLTKFDPRTHEMVNYDARHGLVAGGFIDASHYQAPDGKLFFGGDGGVNAFYPEQIKPNTYQPPVYLTEFRLDGQPVSPGSGSPLTAPINELETLNLSYDQRDFAFEFAALGYLAPEQNRYRYQLEGFHDDWIETDSDNRHASFTGLPAGNYILRVQGSNSDGLWSGQSVTLPITISPPWWQTWWFRLSIFSLIAGIVAGGVYWRIHNIQQYNRELAAQVTARTEQLRASEMRLQEIQQLAHLGGWELQVPNQQLIWTSEIARILGLPPDQPLNLQKAFDFYIPEHRPLIRAAVQQGLEHGTPWDLEMEIITAQGEHRWTRNIGHADVQDDRITRLWGSLQDITKLKRVEIALRGSEARYRLLAENADDVIWTLDNDFRFTYVSPSIQRLRGLTPEAAMRESIADTMTPASLRKVQTAIGKTMEAEARGETQLTTRLEIQQYRQDGSLVWVETVSRPMLDAEGKKMGYIGVSRNIEARKAVEADLRRARDEAEAANRAKSTFLANMSHELRTPLNAVLGFSELMAADPNLTPEQRENLEIIGRSGHHLLALINDVLDLSKIEAGKVTLQPQAFDLHEMLLGLGEMFSLRAEKKGLTVVFDVAPDVPRGVRADAGKLRQVLINLLGNAVKFTTMGGITLRVWRLPDDGGGDLLLRFEVEDTGSGIAPEEMARLFVAFEQTASGRQSQQGTGLGLPISREYVRMMGGDLEVRSEPGTGSCFCFDLPVAVVDDGATRNQEGEQSRQVTGLAPGQPAYKVLVVDDVAASRLLLVKLLAPLGFDVREAEDGRAAVDIWRAWQPALIFLDIRMAMLDGREVAKRIRSLPGGAETVIIALTAGALDLDHAALLAAGFDDVVHKPFLASTLFAHLERHLGAVFVDAPAARALGVTAEDATAGRAPLDLAWVAAMRQAATEGDVFRLETLVAQIQASHPELAGRLAGLVTDFAYDKMLEVMDNLLA